jgi:hypothetical protein
VLSFCRLGKRPPDSSFGDAISVQTSHGRFGMLVHGPQIPAVHSPTHSPALRRRVALSLPVRPSDMPMMGSAPSGSGASHRGSRGHAVDATTDGFRKSAIHPEPSQSCMTQQPNRFPAVPAVLFFSASLPPCRPCMSTHGPVFPRRPCPCVSSPPGHLGLPPHGRSDSPLS